MSPDRDNRPYATMGYQAGLVPAEFMTQTFPHNACVEKEGLNR